jgi:hypothetical protein
VYETTTMVGSQYGAGWAQPGLPVHIAFAPSAQRPNLVQSCKQLGGASDMKTE